MLAVGTAATAGGVVAVSRSESVQTAQRESAASLRGLVVARGEEATDNVVAHGFCTLQSALKRDRPLPAEVSATAAARAAGAAAAMLLPTVHQADGWKNLAIGQAIGDRIAAMGTQMVQDPSVMGCEEAVQALEPHASVSGWSSRFLGRQTRSLVLQTDGQVDALDALASLLEEEESDVVGGSAGPRAALMRSWAGVLLQPALRWVTALDHCCDAHGRQLIQRRTRLLLCGPAALEAAAASDGVVQTVLGAARSAVRLGWLGSLSTLSEGLVVVLPISPDEACVELLLPAGPVPALQVSVEPGCALLLDGRTRWRPADSSGARAFVVFEYADQGSSPWHAALTMARQAAAAATMGIVPLPEIRTAESER